MSYDTPLRSDSHVGADRVSAPLPDAAPDQPIELGVLEQSLAFHVRRAQLVLQRQGLRTRTGPHVGQAGFGMLVLCERNPGLAQFQIAAALDIDKASVVAVIDRLEQLGWVLRRRSHQDRRRHGLWLTPEGAQQLQVLRRQAEEAEAFAQQRLDPQEFQQLLGLLARLT